MIAVSARPRTASGAPRWTIVMFWTIAIALPTPHTTIATTPTQMFGATAAPAEPTASSSSARG